jgi:hypothetical protein
MLDIAEECDITNGRFVRICELSARIECPFVAAVSKKQRPALMRRWKDDHEGPKHLLTARSIDVRLEERPLAWEMTWCQGSE